MCSLDCLLVISRLAVDVGKSFCADEVTDDRGNSPLVVMLRVVVTVLTSLVGGAVMLVTVETDSAVVVVETW